MDSKSKFLILTLLIGLSGAGGYPVSGFPLEYHTGNVYTYTYATEVVFNEGNSPPTAQLQGGVGVKINVVVKLTPVWGQGNQLLVKLVLSNPSLHSVSRPALETTRQALAKFPIFFQWEDGKVGQVYVSEQDNTQAVNLKKGIITLLQMQKEDGERSEIDTTGDCTAKYSVAGNTIAKTKSACSNLDVLGQFSNVNPILAVDVASQAQIKYEIEDNIIKSVTAEETRLSSLNLQPQLASSVFTRQTLELTTEGGKGTTVTGSTLEQVARKLEKELGLFSTSLGSIFEIEQCTPDCTAVADVVAKYRKDLSSESMAKPAAGKAYLALVQAFRNSNRDTLLAVLKAEENTDIVPQLLDITAAAQTTAAQEALMAFLNFDDELEISQAERFLLAAAFSTHPSTKLLQQLLKLYEQNVPNEDLRESIGGALGAVLNTYSRTGDQGEQQIVKDIQKTTLQHLDSCEETRCKTMNLRALANAGIPETIPVLLKYAEEEKDATVSEEAVRALRRMEKHHFDENVLSVLTRIYHQEKRGYDTAVRSKALRILLEHGPTQAAVDRIVTSTFSSDQPELATYAQARLTQISESDPVLKKMVKEVLKNDTTNNYDNLAPGGKSLAFKGFLANTPSSTSTYDMYVENAKAGIMKRSGMDVDIANSNQTLSMYSFGIFSAGLESLLGKEVEDGQEEIEATAGLALDLIGVSLRPITFFTGQGGLMSAVWNAPSEPISALQANLLLQDHHERLHLQNGFVVQLDVQGCVSMDMSGSISISLWNKNSQSLIQNSGTLVVKGSMQLQASSFRTGVEYVVEGSSVIDFSTDVDFYEGVKMCLQMSRPDFVFQQQVTKYESASGIKKGYRATIKRKSRVPQVSYPLPPPNAAECRVLLADQS